MGLADPSCCRQQHLAEIGYSESPMAVLRDKPDYRHGLPVRRPSRVRTFSNTACGRTPAQGDQPPAFPLGHSRENRRCGDGSPALRSSRSKAGPHPSFPFRASHCHRCEPYTPDVLRLPRRRRRRCCRQEGSGHCQSNRFEQKRNLLVLGRRRGAAAPPQPPAQSDHGRRQCDYACHPGQFAARLRTSGLVHRRLRARFAAGGNLGQSFQVKRQIARRMKTLCRILLQAVRGDGTDSHFEGECWEAKSAVSKRIS